MTVSTYPNLLFAGRTGDELPSPLLQGPVRCRLRILNALEALEGSSERERGQKPRADNRSRNVT